MTSERRAYVIVFAVTLGGMCIFGQSVEHWTIQNIFGIIGAGCAAFVNGMTKSPRDGKISDQMAPPVADATVVSDTTTVSHLTAESSPSKP